MATKTVAIALSPASASTDAVVGEDVDGGANLADYCVPEVDANHARAAGPVPNQGQVSANSMGGMIET
jgi:hypothetical protein